MVRFNATANQTYMIAVDGLNGRFGLAVLGWNLEESSRFLPTFLIQPTNQSALLANSVTLVSRADPPSANSQLFYQWFFNGGTIQDGPLIQGANSSILKIQVLIPLLVGDYMVKGKSLRFDDRLLNQQPHRDD